MRKCLKANLIFKDKFSKQGKALGPFTASIDSLVAGTTYYFRAYAINQTDTAFGATIELNTGGKLDTSLTLMDKESWRTTEGFLNGRNFGQLYTYNYDFGDCAGQPYYRVRNDSLEFFFAADDKTFTRSKDFIQTILRDFTTCEIFQDTVMYYTNITSWDDNKWKYLPSEKAIELKSYGNNENNQYVLKGHLKLQIIDFKPSALKVDVFDVLANVKIGWLLLQWII